MNDYRYSVSVLVATYNSCKEELFLTLNSILLQKNVSLEIVITDDGSELSLSEEIKNYFQKKDFRNYILINNSQNKGTVANLYSGITRCNGRYTKFISPGDLFIDENVLHDWLDYLEINDSDLSFGNPVYYTFEKRQIIIHKHYAWPQNIKVYLNKNKALARDYYLLANDTIHGVTTIVKTNVLRMYIEKIVDKVVYAEDCMYRLMLNDGIKCDYFNRLVVLYKCDTGISNSSNTIWRERLNKDLKETDKILIKSINSEKYRRRLLSAISYRENKSVATFLGLLINNPGWIFWKIKVKFNTRYTQLVYDKAFFYECCKAD